MDDAGITVHFLYNSLYFLPADAEQMASHWNAQGVVDGYTSKFWGYFFSLHSYRAGTAFHRYPAIDL
jgi:uncharacterized membrane protein